MMFHEPIENVVIVWVQKVNKVLGSWKANSIVSELFFLLKSLSNGGYVKDWHVLDPILRQRGGVSIQVLPLKG